MGTPVSPSKQLDSASVIPTHHQPEAQSFSFALVYGLQAPDISYSLFIGCICDNPARS